MTQRHILVTNALYYANGPLHLGHILECIQTDIWVRFQKLKGNHCMFFGGTDAHGTLIMLQAEKRGMTPEALVKHFHKEFVKDLTDFGVEYENFYTTHSKENQALSELIYQRLKDKGDIVEKTIRQAYDPLKNMFLPDRYVKGECPKCGAKDQYGDGCEVCGTTYTPTDLKNPVSVVSGATPIEKESDHFFFKLENYTQMLQEWLKQEHLQPQIANKLQEWFEAGLKSWDITRDGPYFGFPIPNAENKYFYVWLDAPIGYMASFQEWCNRTGKEKFEDYWDKNSSKELIHFIGKDIVYFHTLFWPAVLTGADFRAPSAVYVHGFLTINGQKMSKSRGTFITARNYLNHIGPEYLRYYLACKLNNGIDDLDLSFDDFTARVNSDLIGKFVNIASRCAGFIAKAFDNKLSNTLFDFALYQRFVDQSGLIAKGYESREYHRAMRDIMSLADQANQFIDEHKPWELIKTDKEKAHQVCSMGINLFRVLTLYLKPVLPMLAKKAEQFLNFETKHWNDISAPLLNHTIHTYEPLMTRIDPKQIAALLEEGKTMTDQAPATMSTTASESKTDPIAPTISIDDFVKIDLRIAKIENAEHVEGAEKLLKLTLNIGSETRQVFAGIKSAYNPEDLIGKLTVMVANLAPRQMRFGESQGMVLAAGPGGKDLWILEPHQGAEPGMRVK